MFRDLIILFIFCAVATVFFSKSCPVILVAILLSVLFSPLQSWLFTFHINRFVKSGVKIPGTCHLNKRIIITKKLPVIMLSSNEDPSQLLKALEACQGLTVKIVIWDLYMDTSKHWPYFLLWKVGFTVSSTLVFQTYIWPVDHCLIQACDTTALLIVHK